MEAKFNLLFDILSKKKEALSQILNLTINQETVLLSNEETPELNVFFNEMSKEKQKLIDEVINADNFFQSTFNEMSEWFDKNANQYGEQVKKLQEQIKSVIDVDVKIRLQEQKNKELASKVRNKPKIHALKASKSYILNKYKSNNTPKKG